MSNLEAKAEAMRYVTNGTQILSEKARKEDGYYQDPKYIKMAGDILWKGVLVALEFRFPEIKKGKDRPDQTKYRKAIRDGKVSKMFDSAYSQLHLVMGYDGVGDEKQIKPAIETAKSIINWATH
jgi:hypothetical protein